MHNSHEKLMNTRTCRTMMKINVFLAFCHRFLCTRCLSMAFVSFVDQMPFCFLLLRSRFHTISHMFQSSRFVFHLRIAAVSRLLVCTIIIALHFAVVVVVVVEIGPKSQIARLPLHSTHTHTHTYLVASLTESSRRRRRHHMKDSVIRCRHFIRLFKDERIYAIFHSYVSDARRIKQNRRINRGKGTQIRTCRKCTWSARERERGREDVERSESTAIWLLLFFNLNAIFVSLNPYKWCAFGES